MSGLRGTEPGKVRRCHPLADKCYSAVWVVTRSDIRMGDEAPGTRAPVVPIHPALGGQRVSSSYLAAPPGQGGRCLPGHFLS